MYRNTQHWIKTLEDAGELVRIREFVNPHLEIPEITDRVSKASGTANKTLLFENTGTNFPLLINSLGTEQRMAMALGVEKLDDVGKQIEELFKQLMKPKDSITEKLKMLPTLSAISSWMPKVKKGRGDCQQVVMTEPDITKFPVLKCWPEDGGPFLTLPIIHTKDPNTGIRNVGLYRMQVFGPTLTAMHWHRHKVSARHFAEYRKLGLKMPVAVALGGDPVNTYAATAPMPEGIDEYMLAGFIRKKKVELVQCLTQDVQVPSDADIIIEGYIDPDEELILEGPFGDHTGYYSLADFYPRFHITCITHRRDAVYPATIVGIPPQEDAWIGKATERIFLVPIKMTMVHEIVDMELPVEGVFHNLAIIKIKKEYPGQAIKVMHSLWGAGQMMFNKFMIVVDGDIDIHNYEEVARYISENINPETDIHFTQGPVDVLDHSCSVMAFGGKMGIDATKKLPEEKIQSEFPSPQGGGLGVRLENLNPLFPEIHHINDSLLQKGISIVIISVEKNRKHHLRELSEKLFQHELFSEIKIVLFLDHTIDITSVADAVWRFTNNIDPKRDSFIFGNHIAMDGTRKTKELDGFDRDWPNILCSDEKTIQRVDEIWDKLGLGKFIPSPSLKYREQLYKGGAVVQD
ncbi:MAG TPA: menaquinone biosynthesis decarboxylase [Bacteroidia bacterium]|nr:menaquinone biosynthesis decarboxylase [Bacteroidia bacterium]